MTSSAATSSAAAAPAPPADTAVLLVDDRPENLVALEAILAPLAADTGVRLLRAGNAEDALRHVLREGEALAVILLDVVMPGTGGIETAHLIRRRARSEHVPIIFLTALESDRRRVTLAYQSGAVDFLMKPVDADVLRAKVRAFLEIHRRRGEGAVRERRRYADEVRAVREAALRDETALVATIQRIGTALASELNLERLAHRVTEEATALTGAEFGAFVYDVAEPRGEPRARYTVAMAAQDGVTDIPPAAVDLVTGAIPRREEVIRSGDVARDPRLGPTAPLHGTPLGHLPVRSYLAAPVRSRTGEVVGSLLFGHARPEVFAEREERLVVGVAAWAAVAMDNARLYAAERRAREAAEAAHAEAEAARLEAEAAARTKSEFLATMSHEFRTPLNAILGYAQILDMGVLGPATPAQHAHLERLQASARHLLGLVDDVLDVAKVDADRLDVRRDRVMTGAVIAAAITLVHPQATAKGVRLMDLGAGEPGVPFVGDEHRTRQVLVNLLSNAIKFTPPGGEVTVTCSAAAEPDPGVWTPGSGSARAPGPDAPDGSPDAPGWAFVRIEDTGPGIAPQVLGRLFEPFVQGDGALTRAHGGTGLGLAISRRLARLMGGDVVARSRPGAGASFTLWLPTAVPDAETGPDGRAVARETIGVHSGTDARARRTPALGWAPIEEPAGEPLDDAAYAVLYALSVRLAAEAETVAERYVAALRADDRFPGARELPTVQLRDHATPFMGLLASQLMIIGETRGQAPELLGDGSQVQRLMAELHGAQRHRLGWSEADIERETPLLVAEVERALREAVAVVPEAGAGSAEVPDGAEIRAGAVRAATRYAAVVTRHVLAQATLRALRAHRAAKATETP